MKLHISVFELPDGMHVATCAEIPMCQVIRQNKVHATTDVKALILRFLKERVAEGRPFVPELQEIEINDSLIG